VYAANCEALEAGQAAPVSAAGIVLAADLAAVGD
jgi:hypothetical protein